MKDVFGISERGGYWMWMDPGVISILGAVSFFAGVTRLTMSLAVIMMEMTNDIQLLLLIMVTVISAKLIGDYLTHPLYHALMELKCIPFLDAEPHVHADGHALDMELYQASHVMSTPVISLTTVVDARDAARMLLSTSHGGFPILNKIDDEGTGQFIGMISRTELIVLLVR